jgi:opacity protein-like surface antigen
MRKTLLIVALLTVAMPARAFADITGFIGLNTTPTNRTTTGLAVGAGLLVVGFEFEYSSTGEDVSTGAPSLKFGMGSVLLQTPVAIGGFQPYFETGAGFYSEALGARTDSGFAFGTGGGVKISLAGPLRLRVDYRGIKLGSGALASPAHRIYAGLNLKF